MRFLKKDAFDRDDFKKALEEKNLKFKVDLSKSSLTSKKDEASASEKVCLNQKHSWNTQGIGYEAEPTKSKQHQYSKAIKFVLEDRYNFSYFIFICHYCGTRGHIRP